MAESIEKIGWTATADKDWISVTPSHGEGDMDIEIRVISSSTVGDTNTAGTVTIACNDCDTGPYEVKVYRCAPSDCEYKLYKIDNVNIPCSGCNENDTLNITCHYNSEYGCEETSATESYIVAQAISCNDTTSTKTYTKTYNGISFTITQAAGNCCCTCDNLELSKYSVTLEPDGEETVSINDSENCGFNNFNVTSSNASIATASINGNTITINGVSDGNATITVSYELDGTNCSKNISVAVSTECKGYTISPNMQVDCEGGTVIFTANPKN